MRSKISIALYSYWNKVRGTRPVPARQEIEPGDIRHILPDLFILEHSPSGDIRIRLAGTNICNLFGRELRGSLFADLWDAGSREGLIREAKDVMAKLSPAVFAAEARSASGDVERVEISLFPLTSAGAAADRLIGAVAPMEPLRQLTSPACAFFLDSARFVDPATMEETLAIHEGEQPHAVLAATRAGFGDTIRRVLHLRVFEGGRAN